MVRDAVEEALDLLDKGELRVAEKRRRQLDRAAMAEEGHPAVVPPQRADTVDGGPGGGAWWDKVPTKFADWKAKDFK